MLGLVYNGLEELPLAPVVAKMGVLCQFCGFDIDSEGFVEPITHFQRLGETNLGVTDPMVPSKRVYDHWKLVKLELQLQKWGK